MGGRAEASGQFSGKQRRWGDGGAEVCCFAGTFFTAGGAGDLCCLGLWSLVLLTGTLLGDDDGVDVDGLGPGGFAFGATGTPVLPEAVRPSPAPLPLPATLVLSLLCPVGLAGRLPVNGAGDGTVRGAGEGDVEALLAG